MASRLGIGAGIGIPFRNIASGGGKPYLSPEVKEALKAVVIAYGKTNNDSDRAIVKNLVDASNPFVISNAAFKLNSGYGKYEEDFTSWDRIDASTAEISNDGSKIKCINTILNVQYLFNSINKDIPSFKVKISNFTKGNIAYYYRKEDGTEAFLRIEPSPLDKVLELPKSYNTVEGGTGSRGGFYSSNINIGVTIEQIPSFQGAFVTDGVDDLITSTKTVQEMLGGSNEITVVSMIHQIDGNVNYTNGYTNYIRHGGGFIRNSVAGINGKGFNKTGIYGYTSTQLDSSNMGLGNVINNILGDKDDYSFERSSTYTLDDAKYSVQSFVNANNQPSNEGSSVAWYWTIIANKVLTTDQINQVIAYYNLDRTLKPDILCNTIKQGITNENHAEFGDKLIDFSGNGRDIQLNNIAWKGDSGIGKYETDFTKWLLDQVVDITRKYSSFNIKTKNDSRVNSWVLRAQDTVIPSMKVKVTGISSSVESLIYRYSVIDDKDYYIDITSDGIYELPQTNGKGWEGFRIIGKNFNISVEQIPSHAGALCLDGVNDFGKVTGMPIYKDYTVIADYERTDIGNIEGVGTSPVLSKSYTAGQGSFIMNFIASTGNSIRSYSFGTENTSNFNDLARQIFYQSKYKSQGFDITAGTGIDGDSLWLGTARDNDSRFFNGAIYSLMSFPYSMSEFLIERQLKKHKLGTLYPDMVEFRPIVTYDKDLISKLKYFYIPKYANWVSISPGDYLPNNAEISFTVDLRYPVDEVSSNLVFSNLENVRVVKSSGSGNSFDIRAYVTNKSPQKINITIDEYIRYEDIVQPYPVLLRFNDENGNEVSWGGKFKVGSNITRIGSIADPESNLLNGLYSISGLSLNGKAVTSSTIIVEKQMVFRTTATWLLDNNEPKVILSPRLLRIPNSSYKILGHIPDISGHGNHGKINNSAYKLNSGVNGYLVDFTTLKDDGIKGIVRTDSKIYLDKSFNYNQGFWLGRTNNPSPAYKVKVSGIPETGMLTYTGGVWLNLVNGINELPARTNTEEEHGFVIQSPNLDWSNLVIEQIGEYEGAYCLDGVDDFVTIPTLFSGGKQVLMKVNSLNSDVNVIYDQRLPTNMKGTFAIMCDNNLAYSSWNTGQTYIDGILNKNIIGNQLVNITHNLTITNDGVTNNNSKSPFIGKSTDTEKHANMSLYDFMLFDNVSTDDKIKQLNEYVGIEGNTDDLFNETN